MSEKIVQLNKEMIKGQIRESVRGSVEEALIEMYLAGVSVRGWRTSRKPCGAARFRPPPSVS